MERLKIYLEIVPLELVIAIALAGIVTYLLIPANKRIFFSLVMVVPLLTIAQLPGLGSVQAFAKLLTNVGYLVVIIAALWHPGPRRQLPLVVFIYPLMAIVAFAYVLGTDERMLALALRFQWLTLTIAALLLARTIVTREDLLRVVNGLTAGCMIAVLLPLSGLILFRAEAFRKGLARFEPYGVNSNQIGMLFAMAVPLMAYAALSTNNKMWKFICFGAAATTMGMALLTGSRETMLAIAVTSLPVILYLTRRPGITIMAMVVFGGMLTWVFSFVDDMTGMARFASLESTRWIIWKDYITGPLAQRPFTGLLGTIGHSHQQSELVGQHPHNAYLEMMYVGGLSLLVPMLFLLLQTLRSTLKIWRRRLELGVDPLLISILAMLVASIFMQGMFNQVAYWPTYSWSFLGVILAISFIGIASDLEQVDPEWVLPSAEALQDLEDGVYDDLDAYDEYEEEIGESAALPA